MSATSFKKKSELDYELISDKFFETYPIHSIDTFFDDLSNEIIIKKLRTKSQDEVVEKSRKEPSDLIMHNVLNIYQNTFIPYGHTQIVSRLDEIERILKTDLASKDDIFKSKDEIINEQKNQLEETKKYLNKLIVLLEKKSTPRIFSIISFIGFSISSFLLFFSIILGDLIFTTTHFILSSIGFLLMFIMAFLSNQIILKAK